MLCEVEHLVSVKWKQPQTGVHVDLLPTVIQEELGKLIKRYVLIGFIHECAMHFRWCIGEERQWKLKLKILVFVPILLLIATAIALLILNLAHPKRNYDVEITKHSKCKLI